ncbi:MAG: hypothetical protein ACE5F6_10470 [Anaerolineae bacterium]
MQFSTKRAIVQLAKARLHALVVLSILVLALLGRMPESQAGWITCPPQVVMLAAEGRRRPRRGMGRPANGRPRPIQWQHLTHTWHIPLVRSLLLLFPSTGPSTSSGGSSGRRLRLLEVGDEQRGSRRTRDGRTPFVRQQYLARAFAMPQPDTCAGAGVSQVSIASLCTGFSIAWPLEVAQNLVPSNSHYGVRSNDFSRLWCVTSD